MVNSEKIFSIFRDKTVLLTGHTGFKGSWMLLLLKMAGAKIIGYSLAPDAEHPLYNQLKGDDLCELSYFENILNKEKLNEVIQKHQPDFVFHLAAQPLVLKSYSEPVDTFEVNVMGTINVLEAIRKLSKKCIAVMITTDKVYENIEQNYAYKEDDKLGGYDPYSASKAASEIAISSYINSFFNDKDFANHLKKIASARAGNVIGGGDFANNRIVPDMVRFMLYNEELDIRNPNAVRPWQHVIEPVWAYMIIAFYLQNNQNSLHKFNIGPEPTDVLSVKEVVDVFFEKNELKNTINWGKSIGFHEANLLQLDINSAKQILDWSPVLTAQQAIRWTYDWWNNAENEKVKTQNQIEEYLKLYDNKS